MSIPNDSCYNIAVFIKQPIPGFAKTRIAEKIGNEKAIEIYKKLLDRTLEMLLDLNKSVENLKIHLYYTPNVPNNDIFNVLNANKKKQISTDSLGGKLLYALNEINPTSNSPLIFIGCDCYYLDSQTVKKAFDTLKHNDICIGPATDGGYYLIGMKKSFPFLFTNMEWGSSTLFETTKEKISFNGKKAIYLHVLSDVDTIDDVINIPQLKLLIT